MDGDCEAETWPGVESTGSKQVDDTDSAVRSFLSTSDSDGIELVEELVLPRPAHDESDE